MPVCYDIHQKRDQQIDESPNQEIYQIFILLMRGPTSFLFNPSASKELLTLKLIRMVPSPLHT